MPSHYCRKDSLKQYLPGDLNVQIMYRMYEERCRELNKKPEKLWYYRNIFNTNFNLAFHSPRKDICDKCFTHSNSAEKALNQEQHGINNKLGSVEIGSCIWKYLSHSKNQENQRIIFFSDTCGGQNRNVYITTMFLHAINNLDIPIISNLFFESGHSQMECDSVHAHIEERSKNIDIFNPSGWYTVVRMAP